MNLQKEERNILHSNVQILEDKNFITKNKRKFKETGELNDEAPTVKRNEQKITNITTEIFDTSSSAIPPLSSIYGLFFLFSFSN